MVSGQQHAGSGVADVWVGALLHLPTLQVCVAGRWRAALKTEKGRGSGSGLHLQTYIITYICRQMSIVKSALQITYFSF